jgi:hypothetical protein
MSGQADSSVTSFHMQVLAVLTGPILMSQPVPKRAGIDRYVYRPAKAWTTGVRFQTRARDFCLLYKVQTGSGAHQASYPIGDSFSWAKADLSSRSSTEVKNCGTKPPSPIRFRGVVRSRDNFTFP